MYYQNNEELFLMTKVLIDLAWITVCAFHKSDPKYRKQKLTEQEK